MFYLYMKHSLDQLNKCKKGYTEPIKNIIKTNEIILNSLTKYISLRDISGGDLSETVNFKYEDINKLIDKLKETCKSGDSKCQEIISRYKTLTGLLSLMTKEVEIVKLNEQMTELNNLLKILGHDWKKNE